MEFKSRLIYTLIDMSLFTKSMCVRGVFNEKFPAGFYSFDLPFQSGISIWLHGSDSGCDDRCSYPGFRSTFNYAFADRRADFYACTCLLYTSDAADDLLCVD